VQIKLILTKPLLQLEAILLAIVIKSSFLGSSKYSY